MLNSAVGTYVVEIRKVRQQDQWVNLDTDFSALKPAEDRHEKWDIIDVLEQRLSDPQTFQKVRYGDRTAATGYGDSEPQIGMSEENAGLTTDEEQNPKQRTEWEIKLAKIVNKGYWYQDSVRVAKYIHFEVQYGENGDRFQVVKKDDPTPLEVTPEDKQVRTYNVVVAFPDDSEAKNGIAFFESRGSHSVIIPLRDLLKRAFYKMGDKRYFTDVTPFAEKAAIQEAIRSSRVKKLRLLTEAPEDERGDVMRYESREIVYLAPKGSGILNYLSAIVESGFSMRNCDIPEIAMFNPSTIKIEVNSAGGRTKTFTVGGYRNGVMQEILDDVVDPDGTTNSEKFIRKVEEIYKEHHVRM